MFKNVTCFCMNKHFKYLVYLKKCLLTVLRVFVAIILYQRYIVTTSSIQASNCHIVKCAFLFVHHNFTYSHENIMCNTITKCHSLYLGV